jgi:hypothetical protein
MNFNRLTSLDLSNNTALQTLYCYGIGLTSLDISKNTALTYLQCSNNQLMSLDVSKNTALKDLQCLDNQLTTLDVSNNTALTYLRCENNYMANEPTGVEKLTLTTYRFLPQNVASAENTVAAEPTVIAGGKGSFELALAIPTAETFTATFDVALPDKFKLDTYNTTLADDLKSGYTLKITAKGDGVWTIAITPSGTRSATAVRDIVHIAYTVENGLADGAYDLKVKDLACTLANGTTVQQSELVIPVPFDSATASESVAATQVWANGGVSTVIVL